MKKLGKNIKAGDVVINYRGARMVKAILGELCAGSWQEMRGGFPVVQYTDGTRSLLVPNLNYDVANGDQKLAS